ncbi:hypothetical protein [Neisseria weaveri]|nr:hypothetical protein [Neisseria weaveri]
MMMRYLGLAAVLLLAACAGGSGGSTQMYGEIKGGVETVRVR